MRVFAIVFGGIGLAAAIYGLAFFDPNMVEGLGRDGAEAVRPDLRFLLATGGLAILAIAAGRWLSHIGEASSYLLSLIAFVVLGGAVIAGLSNFIFYEALHGQTSWMGRTWSNLLDVVPGTLGSLVGASSVEEGGLRVLAGAARGLGRTLVDVVRHPGYEPIANGPLVLIIFMPAIPALLGYVFGIAPHITRRFTAEQPLWLRLAAQISLFTLVCVLLTAVYLNVIVRQSENLAGSLIGSV